ncbi:MAG: CHAT domain-containing protein [Deltaproteobacteria bacterium]
MTRDDRLHRYFDGALSDEERRAFEEELASSPELQVAFADLMEMDAVTSVVAEERSAAKAPEAPARDRRTAIAVGAVIALAASVLLAVTLTRGQGDLATYFDRTGRRHTEVRVSHAVADRYRPYDPFLAEQAPPSTPQPLELLATLERRGDHDAIVAVYLLEGKADLATPYLDESVDTPGALNDRAAAAIVEKRYEDALELLDRALQMAPSHSQAQWNRGLALEAMGLPLAAANAFDASANDASSQWATAARARAKALREKTSSWKRRWKDANEAGKKMVQTAVPMTPEQAAEFPGIARLHLYDALRGATTKAEVLGLSTVAERLDALASRPVLRRLVQWTAERDFDVRATLALRYRRLAGLALTREETGRLIDDARSHSEPDILLGAIYLGYREIELADELVALANATNDPWFETLGQAVLAERARQRGELDRALSIIADAVPEATVPFRRLGLLDDGARVALTHRRSVLARRHLTEGLALSIEARAWGHGVKLLQTRGWFEVRTNRFALAAAHFDEARLREPERCDVQRYRGALLGVAELNRNQRAAALRVITSNPACPVGVSQTEALVLIDSLPQHTPSPRSPQIERALDTIESSGLIAGKVLFQSALRGRYLIATGSVAQGIEILRGVASKDDPSGEDANGRYGRHLAVGSLIGAHAREGAFDAALGRFAAEVDAEPPTSCALGLSIDNGVFVAVAMDAGGRVRGTFDPNAADAGPAAVMARVPGALVASLEACDEVAVLARAPLAGVIPPLPPNIAWHYLFGGDGRNAAHRRYERAIAVADVHLPNAMELSSLPPYEVPVDTPVRVLRGAEATPARVLAAMKTADEVELYTHGWYDASASDTAMLVLSKDDQGRFALTPELLRGVRLERAPIVMLTACSTTRGLQYRAWTRSLPTALLRSGARAVIASAVPIPARGGQAFFASVRRAMRSGRSPAAAVRDARVSELERDPEALWLRGVVVFSG